MIDTSLLAVVPVLEVLAVVVAVAGYFISCPKNRLDD